MYALPRLGTSITGAAVITFGLFFLMQLLIATGNQPLVKDTPGGEVTLLTVRPDTPPVIIEPPVRPEENNPPEIPKVKPTNSDNPGKAPVIVFDPVPPDTKGGGIPIENNTVTPVFTQAPPYPKMAEARAIEGYALIQFTVGADGKVYDAKILEENPTGYGFGRAALKATKKFRFNPRIIDGEKVATTGIREKFQFEMEE